MGCITCPHAPCSIAARVISPLTYLDVGHGVVDGGSLAGRKPVLHVRVSVSEPVAGQAWNWIVQVCDTVLVARLLRDITGQLLVADAWRTVREDIAGETVLTEPRTCHGGHGCAQTVTCGNDAEVWVAFARRFHESRYGRMHVVE